MQTIEQRLCSLSLSKATQWFGVFFIAFLFSFSFATQSVSAASNRYTAPARRINSASSVSCAPCEGEKKYGKAGAKLGKKISCHPKGYVDPKIAQNYKKAIRDLHHAGIQPKVT